MCVITSNWLLCQKTIFLCMSINTLVNTIYSLLHNKILILYNYKFKIELNWFMIQIKKFTIWVVSVLVFGVGKYKYDTVAMHCTPKRHYPTTCFDFKHKMAQLELHRSILHIVCNPLYTYLKPTWNELVEYSCNNLIFYNMQFNKKF